MGPVGCNVNSSCAKAACTTTVGLNNLSVPHLDKEGDAASPAASSRCGGVVSKFNWNSGAGIGFDFAHISSHKQGFALFLLTDADKRRAVYCSMQQRLMASNVASTQPQPGVFTSNALLMSVTQNDRI